MKVSENNILWFIAFVVVYSNGSWLQIDNNIAIKVFLLLLVLFYVILKGRENKISAPNILVVFLLAFPLVSTYLVNYSPNVNIVNIIFTSCLLLLFSCIPINNLYQILERYCRIIFFLVCVAVPLGLLFLFFPNLLESTPKVHSGFFDMAGGYWYNLVVFTERSIPDFRVQSIFWEPGAWAYNQMIAFYYLIIIRKEYKKIPIFLLSLVLTLSTSGLIACLICLLLLVRKASQKMLFISVLAFLVFAGLLTYVILSNDILADVFYQNTIGKFSSDSISFEDRSVATANAFNIANQNWLFGIGRLDNESFVYVTSCISEISYQLGYVYLIVYCTVFFQVFRGLGIIAGFLFCFILLNSEAYSFFPLNIFLIALGCKIILLRNEPYRQVLSLKFI